MPEPPNLPDYVSEGNLRAEGIDPDELPVLGPWVVTLTGHNGVRRWDRSDQTPLLEGGDL